ncbi:MAG: NAD-dependent epimerase/dehydratase family protein [Solirubrobacteraceae bacterium]
MEGVELMASPGWEDLAGRSPGGEDLAGRSPGGEDLAGRSILVTGADGLLGSWLAQALLRSGARVVAIRRDEPVLSGLSLLGLEHRVDIVRGDICSEGLVARALNEYDVDDVLHLAAQTLVGTANRAPLSTFETNIRGTWLVLEACRQAGVQRVIVASSDKAYGRQDELPYHERQPLQPSYPYDVSKAAADLLARSYWHTFSLPVAVTRFANLYGGADNNRSRLVPEAVCAALAGRAPVVRSDGSPERDFLYVEDAVRAYLAILAAIGRGEGLGEAFNAGGGAPHRVRDVVALICRLAGSEVEPEIRGEGVPSGEIDRQWVDATKLRQLTGWGPTVTLEEGLRRTIDWYREHPATMRG